MRRGSGEGESEILKYSGCRVFTKTSAPKWGNGGMGSFPVCNTPSPLHHKGYLIISVQYPWDTSKSDTSSQRLVFQITVNENDYQ